MFYNSQDIIPHDILFLYDVDMIDGEFLLNDFNCSDIPPLC